MTEGEAAHKSPHVVHERVGAVLRLTLDRPDKKNALTDAMYAALAAGLIDAADAPEIRVVLLAGAGGAFTAGNDIADFMAVASGDAVQADRSVHRFLEQVAAFPKPLVAAVPGVAIGVGTTMLLHCDYVILGESARLAAPFVGLGVVPEAGSSLLLPACIGHQRAFAMFALGEVLDAKRAAAWGLANRVVADGALAEEALAVAAKLATLSAGAVAMTKRLMRDHDALAARMAEEANAFATCLATPEAKAAFAAFATRKRG